MASNPDDFLRALIGTTGLGYSNGQQVRADQLNNQIGQQQVQQNALQLSAIQQQQQRAQQYQQDVASYYADPKPERLARIASMYPEQADALAKSYKMMDEPVRTSRVLQLDSLRNSAMNNRPDLAIKQLNGVIAAEKAQGLDTSEAEDALGALQGGDDTQKAQALKGIVAFTQAHLAAADPAFAKVMGIGAEDTHVLSPGSELRGNRGELLARNSEYKPQVEKLRDASGREYLVQVGGGDQASGASGSAGSPATGTPRRVLGWTPRASNGGDNNDAVVDAKLAALSKATGVGVDDPLSAEQAAAVIAAIPATEGGAGDLPQRNNNPAAIKDGAFARKQPGYAGSSGGYAKFKTADAGMSAAQKLGQTYYARGQRSIRDIIEGRPIAGPVPQSANHTGMGNVVAMAPDSGPAFRMLTPEEKSARGLDPRAQFQIGPNGQVAALGGKQQQTLNENQSKATGLLRAAVAAASAMNQVRDYRPSIVANALYKAGDGGDISYQGLSQAERRVLNAQLAFSNAILRLESGAAIGRDETLKKAKTLFVLPGDGPEVARDKQDQREAALEGLKAAAGPGAHGVKLNFLPGGKPNTGKQQATAAPSGFRIVSVRPK